MGTSAENIENAPIAFVLVVCAGLSTCIGAAFVFNTRLVGYCRSFPVLRRHHETVLFEMKHNTTMPATVRCRYLVGLSNAVVATIKYYIL